MLELNKKFINEHYIEMIKKVDAQSDFIIPEKISNLTTSETLEASWSIARTMKYKKEHKQLRHERRNMITHYYNQENFDDARKLVDEYLDQEVIDFVDAFPEFEGVIKGGRPVLHDVTFLDDSEWKLPSFKKLKNVLK